MRAPRTFLLGITAAARLVGTHPNELRRHDDELKPIRDHADRRVYHRLAVERWAKQRDQRRAAKLEAARAA